IPLLIAIPLRRQHQLALAGDATALQRLQARLDMLGQAWAGGEIPAQHGFRGYLVDVLPAGAAGADVGPGELAVGDLQLWINDEHDSGTSNSDRSSSLRSFTYLAPWRETFARKVAKHAKERKELRC